MECFQFYIFIPWCVGIFDHSMNGGVNSLFLGKLKGTLHENANNYAIIFFPPLFLREII